MEEKILNQKPLPLAEVLSLLKDRAKGGDLNPVEQKVHDFAKQFSKLNKSKVAQLRKDIESLEIPRLSEDQLVELVNIVPLDLGEVRAVLAGSKTTVTPDNIKKLVEVMRKYE